MTARLAIVESGYVLSRQAEAGWVELARLPGGAATLLQAGPAGVGEAQMEAAIERAEDWLMPHATGLQGDSLEVLDESGRLRAGLRAGYSGSHSEWTVEELEALFLQLVDRTLGARSSGDDPAFIADVVLLRELAHHGRLRKVRILQQPR